MPMPMDGYVPTFSVFVSLVSGAAILQTDEALCAIRLYAFGGHPGSGYRFLLFLVAIELSTRYLYRYYRLVSTTLNIAVEKVLFSNFLSTYQG